MRKNQKGFTLIELLIVIAIIGFLAAAILVAVDPVKRIQDARNAKRWAEVNAILNAILTKQVDAKAVFNGDEGTTNEILTGADAQVIVRDGTGVVCTAAATRPGCTVLLNTTSATSCVADLSASTSTTSSLVPNYIAEIPIDPLGDGAASPCNTANAPTSCASGTVGDLPLGDDNTGYYIHRTNGNRLEIGACYPDDPDAVNVEVKVKR